MKISVLAGMADRDLSKGTKFTVAGTSPFD